MADSLRTTLVPFKSGTTAQNDAYTGQPGEITIDKTLRTLRVHDGAKAGGEPLLRLSDVLQVAGATKTAQDSAAAAQKVLADFVAMGGSSGVNTGAMNKVPGVGNIAEASVLMEVGGKGVRISVTDFFSALGAEMTDLSPAGPLTRTDTLSVVQSDGTERRVSIEILADIIGRIVKNLI